MRNNDYDFLDEDAEAEWQRFLVFASKFTVRFVAEKALYEQLIVPDWHDFSVEVCDSILQAILEDPRGDWDLLAKEAAEKEAALWVADVLAVHRTRLEA